MTTELTVEEFKRNVDAVLARASGGEEFILLRGSEPPVRIAAGGARTEPAASLQNLRSRLATGSKRPVGMRELDRLIHESRGRS